MNTEQRLYLRDQLEELESFKYQLFNANTALMASRLVRVIRKNTGDIIRLSEKHMLSKLCSAVIKLDDNTVTTMCQNLFTELLEREYKVDTPYQHQSQNSRVNY